MKKINYLLAGLFFVATGFAAISCSSLTKSIAKPTLSFNSIQFASLDTEGVTLKCNYAIKNPYPVSLSLAKVDANITCNESPFTTLTANQGVSLSANKSSSNSFNFKVPYTSLLNFAKSYNSSKTLPFKVTGNASLKNIPLLSTMTLPFSKTVNVPVIKPTFSLSNPKLVLPTLSEMVSAFKSSGMNATSAASMAANILAGKKVDSNVFDNVNLNMKLNFNLGVKNEGGAAWNYLLKSCSIKTADSSLINLDVSSGANSISSSSGTIPLTATLNTLKAGKFITQILNKSGTNPTFSLDSGVSFSELGISNIPLSYSKEIPLSNFGLTK